MPRGMVGLVGATLLAVAITAACAGRPRPDADARCAGEAASPITINGDFHVVYGDGPTFHLVWNGRSAALEFAERGAGARDSLLLLARRRVTVVGLAIADSTTICVATVTAASGDGR